MKKKWMVIMANIAMIAGLFFLFTKQYIGFVKADNQKEVYFFHKGQIYQAPRWIICRLNGKTVMAQIKYNAGEKVPENQREMIASQLNQGTVPNGQCVVRYMQNGKSYLALCHQNNIIGIVSKSNE